MRLTYNIGYIYLYQFENVQTLKVRKFECLTV